MKQILPPSMVAAGIAGAGIGMATGLFTKGEELENQDATVMQQVGSGIPSGIAGAGIGLGVSGTALALKSILKK